MSCLDCALDEGRTYAIAVAVCHACGAGVCVEHAVERAHHSHLHHQYGATS